MLGALLALSLSPAFASSAVTLHDHEVDLTELFDEERDQCTVGACHTFASIALLEAAYRRRYSQSRERLLSDADLFIQKQIVHEPRFEEKLFTESGRASLSRSLVEGGHVEDDLRFALRHGVASFESVPWDEFLRRFDRMRRHASVTPVDAKTGVSTGKNWTSLDDYYYGGLDGKTIARERGETRRRLAGFSVRVATFSYRSDLAPESPQCRRLGAPALAAIKDQLVRRRPVALSLDVNFLAGYAPKAGRPAWHGILLRGYRVRDGRHTLLVRNSWGEDRSPDIDEAALCRVSAATWLEP